MRELFAQRCGLRFQLCRLCLLLRRLCRKGAAANQSATVTPLVTREAVLQAQEDALSHQAGGLSPLLTAFFSGRKLTKEQAEELKALIDQHTWDAGT